MRVYQPGGAAPLSLTLVNNGASADKLLSVMRQAFGGHVELPTGE